MTIPDPDRLAQNAFAARMRQQGINRRWEQVEGVDNMWTNCDE
jgi:hypothetical protein